MDVNGVDVRVIGVGGAGGNALGHLAGEGIPNATLVAINTDAVALERLDVGSRILIGRRTTRGLGAGGRPDRGWNAAGEQIAEIRAAVDGADLVFVAAGMGGGTGTGAAPFVARIARETGALTVGVVTTPFGFEGAHRSSLAFDGLCALGDEVDALLTVPNERLTLDDLSVREAFRRADSILAGAVRGIGDLVTQTGLVNLDFADVAAVLRGGGRAVMGSARGVGRDRARVAVERALDAPLLLDDSIEGARGVLLSFTIDPKIGIHAIHEAAAKVHALVHDDADVFFGVTVDPTLVDEIRVTLVAAGLDREEEVAPEPAVAPAKRRNALVMLDPAPAIAPNATPIYAPARARAISSLRRG
ncbi:MAG: cell division protein FtsZ [Sandaracinaceae bacterium]